MTLPFFLPHISCVLVNNPVYQLYRYVHCRSDLYAGVKVTTKEHGEVTCKTRLLFALADLPAKAALYNITQFNMDAHTVYMKENRYTIKAYVNKFSLFVCVYIGVNRKG